MEAIKYYLNEYVGTRGQATEQIVVFPNKSDIKPISN